MNKFRLGDVVELRGSGGPRMTVSQIADTSTRTTCIWFLSVGNTYDGPFFADFPAEALKLSEQQS